MNVCLCNVAGSSRAWSVLLYSGGQWFPGIAIVERRQYIDREETEDDTRKSTTQTLAKLTKVLANDCVVRIIGIW